MMKSKWLMTFTGSQDSSQYVSNITYARSIVLFSFTNTLECAYFILKKKMGKEPLHVGATYYMNPTPPKLG